jgi:hypothetical protein
MTPGEGGEVMGVVIEQLRREARRANAQDRAARWSFVLDAIDSHERGRELGSGTRLALEGFLAANLPCTYGGGIARLLSSFDARVVGRIGSPLDEHRSALDEYVRFLRRPDPLFGSYADCAAMADAIEACLHATLVVGTVDRHHRETLEGWGGRFRGCGVGDRYSSALSALYATVIGNCVSHVGTVAEIRRGAAGVQEHRDSRRVVFETLGCALAVLRRLSHTWCDEDVRKTLTQVRSALSVAQSKIKERIDE